MTSMTIYQKVAAGELTPEQGAELMMPPKKSLIRQPTWMPVWIFVVCVVVVSILLAPFLSNRNERA